MLESRTLWDFSQHSTSMAVPGSWICPYAYSPGMLSVIGMPCPHHPSSQLSRPSITPHYQFFSAPSPTSNQHSNCGHDQQPPPMATP